MSETLASLGSLITAIERYERLLTMNMSELETQYIEMRLSEKRLALALFAPAAFARLKATTSRCKTKR
jgi:hypothetical protein